MKRIPTTLPLLLAPPVALAHPGHGTNLVARFARPFTGAGHLLAMTGVGLWAAMLAGRARWAVAFGGGPTLAFAR